MKKFLTLIGCVFMMNVAHAQYSIVEIRNTTSRADICHKMIGDVQTSCSPVNDALPVSLPASSPWLSYSPSNPVFTWSAPFTPAGFNHFSLQLISGGVVVGAGPVIGLCGLTLPYTTPYTFSSGLTLNITCTSTMAGVVRILVW